MSKTILIIVLLLVSVGGHAQSSKPIVQADSPKKQLILRDKPDSLSLEQVEVMLKDKNFFDHQLNQLAPGWKNQLVPKTLKGTRVVIDRSTGLMWQQSGSSKYLSYAQAQEYVNEMNTKRLAGFTDWRFPTLEEVMSLMESKELNGALYIDPMFDKNQRWIWTADLSTSQYSGRSLHWMVDFDFGLCLENDIYYSDDYFVCYYVRLVRSGLSLTGR